MSKFSCCSIIAAKENESLSLIFNEQLTESEKPVKLDVNITNLDELHHTVSVTLKGLKGRSLMELADAFNQVALELVRQGVTHNLIKEGD